MESQHRLYNPHLRARLTESLEAILPIADNEAPAVPNLGVFHREQLFLTHPHRQHVSRIFCVKFIKRFVKRIGVSGLIYILQLASARLQL